MNSQDRQYSRGVLPLCSKADTLTGSTRRRGSRLPGNSTKAPVFHSGLHFLSVQQIVHQYEQRGNCEELGEIEYLCPHLSVF